MSLFVTVLLLLREAAVVSSLRDGGEQCCFLVMFCVYPSLCWPLLSCTPLQAPHSSDQQPAGDQASFLS